MSRLQDHLVEHDKIGLKAQIIKLIKKHAKGGGGGYSVGGSDFPEAPVDGKIYGRKDSLWVEVVSGGTPGDEQDPVALPKIGTLASLLTTAKNTIVASINELYTKFSSYYTKTEVDEIITGIELTPGPQGLPGPAGADGQDGAQGVPGTDGADGADGLTTSVNGVTQVGGAITIDPDDLDDTSTTNKFVDAAEKAVIADAVVHTGDQHVLGDFGIGTNNPNRGEYAGRTVTIAGTSPVVIEGIREVTAGDSLVATWRGGNNANSALGGFTVSSGSTGSKGKVKFQVSDGSTIKDRMTIDENGTVTIDGTIDGYAKIASLKIPFYKLDGTLDVIPLTSDQKIPFYTSAGVLDPIALTT